MKFSSTRSLLTLPLLWLCAALLVITVFLPTGGLGFVACGFHRITGYECPGCGMTRSLTSMTHGQFSLAWSYHPLGLVLHPVLILLALAAVVPALRRRILDLVDRHPGAATGVFWSAVGLMILFGISRWFFPGWWF